MDQQQPILQALAAADPEVAERLVSRRAAIARGAGTTAAVAAGLRLASVPVALAALSRDAFGQQALPAVVIGVLNYALVLEELEYEFYQRGTDAPNLIPAADRAIFETIRAHELDHRDFLRRTLGAAARPKPTFDFTAGNGANNGPFADVFTNYETFKAVAQAFEDTGVRAYKGQAAALLPYKDVLVAALTIHSVEARHAAQVRRLRGTFADQGPFGQAWPNGNQTDIPGTAAVYAGEDNVVQGGVDLGSLPTLSAVGRTEITEAFDEPLTQAQVLAIVDPFLA
jgi:rubrerythrin